MGVAMPCVRTLLLGGALASGACAVALEDPHDTGPEPPNFLVIVADDLGWSDIGVLGGEIRTPSIDRLAQEGTLVTSFYVAPTCAPTRAMLMTGVDHHEAGLGVQSGLRASNQVGINYEGQLHDGVVTVAEALAAHGYQTSMTGKWHLANEDAQGPHNRGFQRSFALLTGGASHFADQRPIAPVEIPEYVRDGEPVHELPADFYSSTAYAGTLIDFLEQRDANAPFFAYLSFTAPHDPLHVPDEWLDRYSGAYADGPVATRRARAERQEALGLIPDGAGLWNYPRFPAWFPNHAAPWDERPAEQRAKDARRMEIYAAMVELMDAEIGRVVDYLAAQDVLDDTYVLFFSDNGASSPGPLVYPGVTQEWFEEHWTNAHDRRGQPGDFTVLGREWASAAVTPWKLFKNSVSEGGIRSPLIVRGPAVAARGFNPAIAHVTDVAPTLYDLADIQPASDSLFESRTLPQGVSLMPVLTGAAPSVRESVGVHLFGNRGYRRGQWKISNTQPPLSTGQWELFDLEADPGEVRNLAEARPELLEELLAEYDGYLERHGVILPAESPLTAGLRELYPEPCDWWCELRFSIIGLLN
ncbi:MAG: arylsulfatase [Gammaproteobacteria bacterium]|nr:arylsulfatase [Gammaproteobacteria bacterium]